MSASERDTFATFARVNGWALVASAQLSTTYRRGAYTVVAWWQGAYGRYGDIEHVDLSGATQLRTNSLATALEWLTVADDDGASADALNTTE